MAELVAVGLESEAAAEAAAEAEVASRRRSGCCKLSPVPSAVPATPHDMGWRQRALGRVAANRRKGGLCCGEPGLAAAPLGWPAAT